MASKSLTYKQSGVDIDAGNLFVRGIKPHVRRTQRPEVLSSIGHFAGLFSLNGKKKGHPVLVASTDGVGTKLKLALDCGRVSGLGQDLVAMSANDLICLGAEPLFFLDYYATGKLRVPQATEVVAGIARACEQIHCTLLGGETAEMPSLYREGEFDLAGFIVGIVDRRRIIDGRKVRAGDQVIGLASSGPHSNGYSLIRKIVATRHLSLRKIYPPLRRPLGDLLLAPTRLYVRPVLEVLKKYPVHGIAHITGGGLLENLPRVVPRGLKAVLRRKDLRLPPLFRFLKEQGGIAEAEMDRVFNCGIGLMLVVPKQSVGAIVKKLKSLGENPRVLGEIVRKKRSDTESLEIA